MQKVLHRFDWSLGMQAIWKFKPVENPEASFTQLLRTWQPADGPRPPGTNGIMHWPDVQDPQRFLPDYVLQGKPPNTELPGMFQVQLMPVVSQQVRELIEAHDPGMHQFHPCRLQASDGAPVTETPYFHLIVRRTIDFGARSTHASASAPDTNAGTPVRFKYLTAHPELIRAALELPLWSLTFGGGSFFLSEPLYNTLKEAGTVGLVPFSKPGGKLSRKGLIETVSQFWFDL